MTSFNEDRIRVSWRREIIEFTLRLRKYIYHSEKELPIRGIRGLRRATVRLVWRAGFSELEERLPNSPAGPALELFAWL